jgi:hypothetical protein
MVRFYIPEAHIMALMHYHCLSHTLCWLTTIAHFAINDEFSGATCCLSGKGYYKLEIASGQVIAQCRIYSR